MLNRNPAVNDIDTMYIYHNQIAKHSNIDYWQCIYNIWEDMFSNHFLRHDVSHKKELWQYSLGHEMCLVWCLKECLLYYMYITWNKHFMDYSIPIFAYEKFGMNILLLLGDGKN